MTIRLAFTKGPQSIDMLVVTRSNGAIERVDCPKQRIAPHDMIHYAVEAKLFTHGFLGRVAAGEPVAFTMAADSESDGVERLVEVIQGDAWSGGTSPACVLIDLYRVTCEARSCPMLPIDPVTVDAIRDQLRVLTRDWNALRVGETMMLEFAPPR